MLLLLLWSTLNIISDIRLITHEALWRHLMTLFAQTCHFLFPSPSSLSTSCSLTSSSSLPASRFSTSI